MKNNVIKIALTVAVIAALALGLCGSLNTVNDYAVQNLCIMDFDRVLH